MKPHGANSWPLLLLIAVTFALQSVTPTFAQKPAVPDPEIIADSVGGVMIFPSIRLFREQRRLQLETLKETAYRSKQGEYTAWKSQQTVGCELACKLAMLIRRDLASPGERAITHLMGFEEPQREGTDRTWYLVPAKDSLVGDWVVQIVAEAPFPDQVVIRFKETGGAAAMRLAEAKEPLPEKSSDESRRWLLRSYARTVQQDRQQYLDLLGELSHFEDKKAMTFFAGQIAELFESLETSQVSNLIKLVNAGILLKGERFEPIREAFHIERGKNGWGISSSGEGQKRYVLKLAWEPVFQFTGWQFEVVTRVAGDGKEEVVENCRLFYEWGPAR
ncbi:hypothetical protein [Verrucomicrobium sp. BvORR106]|uniref:hypothetical protein n=1 Tax=Verrucomicrobium sp. BvORR106 TaxID=1403819 RepID=UPI000571EF2E|nr:hypothetical protein [Verrucomicrobium sp. BvORR106]